MFHDITRDTFSAAQADDAGDALACLAERIWRLTGIGRFAIAAGNLRSRRKIGRTAIPDHGALVQMERELEAGRAKSPGQAARAVARTAGGQSYNATWRRYVRKFNASPEQKSKNANRFRRRAGKIAS
jgi:hypothetical protein